MSETPVAPAGGPAWSSVFFVVWICLGIAGFFLFYFGTDAAFKRRVYPWYVALAGGLFLVFTFIGGFPASAMLLVVPALVLVSFLSIRATRFCDACGRTVLSQMFFSRPEFCSKCG